MKRFRKPKLKDGELRIYYGKLPHDNPDVVLAWQGDSMMKRDTALLHHFICSQHPDPHFRPIFGKMNKSLVDQLVERGYDITTLNFSIMKKVAT